MILRAFLYYILLPAFFVTESALAAESFLFSIPYRQNDYPFRKHTDVYSIDPADGKSRLVFSDKALQLLLLSDYNRIVLGGNRMFAYAGLRKNDTGRYYVAKDGPKGEHRAAIYELDYSGNRKYRKIFVPQGEQRVNKLFASPDGSRIAYFNYLSGHKTPEGYVSERFIFVHDSDTGQLLERLELGKICVDCEPLDVFWLNNKQLFMWLETGDEHLIQTSESEKKAGFYIVSVAGDQKAAKLKKELFTAPAEVGIKFRRGHSSCRQSISSNVLACNKEYWVGNNARGEKCSYNFHRLVYTINISNGKKTTVGRLSEECMTDIRSNTDLQYVMSRQYLSKKKIINLWLLKPRLGKVSRVYKLERGARWEKDLFLIGWPRAY